MQKCVTTNNDQRKLFTHNLVTKVTRLTFNNLGSGSVNNRGLIRNSQVGQLSLDPFLCNKLTVNVLSTRFDLLLLYETKEVLLMTVRGPIQVLHFTVKISDCSLFVLWTYFLFILRSVLRIKITYIPFKITKLIDEWISTYWFVFKITFL